MKPWRVIAAGLLAAGAALHAAAQYVSPYVTLQGTLATSSGTPAANATLTLVPSQVCFVPGQSVVVQESQCSSDANGNVVGVGNPQTGPRVAIQYTGTLPTGNYYVEFTWYDQFGIQSLASPEVQAQLTHAGELQILPPAGAGPPQAIGMAVYIGTAPGAETLQGQTNTPTAQFTQAVPLGFPVASINITGGGQFSSCPTAFAFTASDAGSGASAVPICASIGGGLVQITGYQSLAGGESYTVPPVVTTNGSPSVAPVLSANLNTSLTPPIRNLTSCRVVANDACFPTGTGYTASLVDADGNNLFNYSEMWQFFGPGSTYNLSQGIPYYHGQVTYPIPILTIPFNHNPQAISGPLSLSGYNLYSVGAIGVGTATPAWGVDVEGSGLDSEINAQGGYLVAGLGGSSGQTDCLASVNAGPYNTAVPCVTSLPTLNYQGVLYPGPVIGDLLTEEPYIGIGNGLTAVSIAPLGSDLGRTVFDVNGTQSNWTTDPAVVGAAAAGPAGDCGQWDSVGGMGSSGAPCARAVAQKNCLSVACAGGTYSSSGGTFTNSTSGAVFEEVEYTATLGGGGTGGDSDIVATVASLPAARNGLTNQCDGTRSISFVVPPSDSFTVSMTQIDGCGGATLVITGWVELTF